MIPIRDNIANTHFSNYNSEHNLCKHINISLDEIYPHKHGRSICIQILRTSAKGIYNLTIFQAGSCAIQCDDGLFLYVPPWWFFPYWRKYAVPLIFGNNIEDAMGHGRIYFLSLSSAGIVAALRNFCMILLPTFP